MSTLHVRFGSMMNTTTPSASSLILLGARFRRMTPGGESIENPHYEGDWDAPIESEIDDFAARQIVRVWTKSWIEE